MLNLHNILAFTLTHNRHVFLHLQTVPVRVAVKFPSLAVSFHAKYFRLIIIKSFGRRLDNISLQNFSLSSSVCYLDFHICLSSVITAQFLKFWRLLKVINHTFSTDSHTRDRWLSEIWEYQKVAYVVGLIAINLEDLS